MDNGTVKQWAITDQHTDLVAGVSSDGTTVTGSKTYTPFGEVTATEGASTPLGYQSGWTDPSSGDVNMAARWYGPRSGGFVSRDTWLLDPNPSAQINRYTYANSDPVNGTDPTGHFCACGGGHKLSPRLSGMRWRSSSGGAHDAAPRNTGAHRGRPSARPAYRGNDPAARAQTRRNIQEMRRYDAARTPVRVRPTRPAARGSGSYRGSNRCTYSCGTGATRSASRARGTGSGSGTYTPRGTAIQRPTQPRKPTPPQNPNRGRNPAPAPARPAPKPDWNPKSGGWQPGDGWRMVAGTLALLDAADGDYYGPERSSDPYPASGTDHGSSTSDEHRNDCRRGGAGWVDPSDTDPSNGHRAVGVEACLDSAYIEANPGTKTEPAKVTPPGYHWARSYAGYLANRPPKNWVNACHLLGAQLSGSGTDLRNLSTCARSTNATRVDKTDPGMPGHMLSIEDRVKSAVDVGQIVHYRVKPVYSGPRTVPMAFEMYAQGFYADGRPGITVDDVVPNWMYGNRDGQWHNIGLVVYKGVPTPVGATP
ncbi:hypothetical protein SSP531S_02690 [Streptomyces spongiicola]|uniref:Type VII secretion system protein EssD-like domain-containing protein n=1 Tax=Streptomyces spongiicola TaxID=1690221 RepID=A0A388SQL3_9ACTN|nr:RHS repeat-associated core domain-containing protein [Streptomyces spongiicola]GBP98876.1 hypothetical protein SSP531S_02690 [Streptomyces spongiicola]